MPTFEKYSIQKARQDVGRSPVNGGSQSRQQPPVIGPYPERYSAFPGFDLSTLSARAFYEGDHWQNGIGWTGPMPRPTTEVDMKEAIEIQQEIAKVFTSANIIREVVDRVVDGVLGHEPLWSAELTRVVDENSPISDAERAAMDEADSILTDIWDWRGIKEEIKKSLRIALCMDRASVRTFIPRGRLLENNMIPTAPIEKALRRFVFVESVGPESAAIVTDVNSRDQAGVVVWQEGNVTIAEVSFVDDMQDDQPTTISIYSTNSTNEGGFVESVDVDLGAQLPVFEITVPRLITEQVMQLQKLANLNLTMMQRNSVLGGFLERTILNGMPPGRWVTEADGTRSFKADPYYVGAGVTNWVSGAEYEDSEGNVMKANPSVVYRDPISPENFIGSIAEARKAILREVRQIHVEMTGDGAASAISRIQARADYLNSLRKPKEQVEECMRSVLTAMLQFAELISGQKGRFDGLNVSVECKVDAGPLTPEERAAIADLYKLDLLSRETAMQLLGVEDVDAEIQRIDEERTTKPIALADAVSAGWTPSPEIIAEIDERAGFKATRTPEQVKAEQAAKDEQKRLEQEAMARAVGNA